MKTHLNITLGKINALYYLSFADDKKHLGSCVVEASDLTDAITRTWKLGLNPGGSVMGQLMPKEYEKMFPINKLMTKEEMEAITPMEAIGDTEEEEQSDEVS